MPVGAGPGAVQVTQLDRDTVLIALESESIVARLEYIISLEYHYHYLPFNDQY